MHPRKKVVQILFILILSFGLLGPSSLSGESTFARAHPYLIQVAYQAPDQRVSVIVQKVDASAQLDDTVGRLGGIVTKELGIINSFVAEMDAGAALALARQPEVSWVSLDSPVTSQAINKEQATLYLLNTPGFPDGDTSSHPELPLGIDPPADTPLYNYDADRDYGPGLLILRGGSGPGESDPAKVQRWQTAPFTEDFQIKGKVQLKLYAVMQDFQNSGTYGKINAYLIDRYGDQRYVIAETTLEKNNWANKWKRRSLGFDRPTYLIPAGHQLELALTVDAASEADMWFAYGTQEYSSQLLLSVLSEWPTSYLEEIDASYAWSLGYTGSTVRVAIIDSGSRKGHGDFSAGSQKRILEEINLRPDAPNGKDQYGHGTYVSGLIGSNGNASSGKYMGVAPGVEILSVRVSDEFGSANLSDVIAGMQWVFDNKDVYNIRVVNLALNSSVPESYHTNPLDAAIEILWFNGIVVVVPVGNTGSDQPGVLYPPANDPFAIVVGAVDGMSTPDPSDDLLAEFSAFGITSEGFSRPDLVAPGVYLVSSMNPQTRFNSDYSQNVVQTIDILGKTHKWHFVASGTSASTAIVTGAAALLLDAIPELNPDQVKYLMTTSATPLADIDGTGSGILNIENMLNNALSYSNPADIPTANTDFPASQMLWTGTDPILWNSVAWNSVAWNSVAWNSVAWNSVAWNSITWTSIELDY